MFRRQPSYIEAEYQEGLPPPNSPAIGHVDDDAAARGGGLAALNSGSIEWLRSLTEQ